MTRIKICGITSVAAAEAAVDAGADYLGFVFAEASPRHVTESRAAEIVAALPAHVTPVAVFRNHDRAFVERWTAGWVQLHGDEAEDDARLPQPVIKALAFDADAIRRWNRCPHVEALLIEGPRAGVGEGFDHGRLAGLMPEIDKPVWLAGGLSPDNVADAIRTVRPFAVDVSSGVESGPGRKDPARIRAFCDAVRGSS